MFWIKIILLAFLLNLGNSTTKNGEKLKKKEVPIVTIAAPHNLQQYSFYKLSLSVHDSNEYEQIRFEICINSTTNRHYYNNNQLKNNSINIASEEYVKPGSIKELSIPIQHLPSKYEPYKLNIKVYTSGSNDSFLFHKDSFPLSIVRKNYSVLIQTDKVIYKPGETVRFRMLVLDRYLRPVGSHVLNNNIKLFDAKRNVIKIWKEQPVAYGLFSDSILISEEPVLGDWSLEVESDDGDGNKNKLAHTFTIDKYVLPKIGVEIMLPPYVVFRDPKVTATIKSLYTYGGDANGQGTITMSYVEQHPSYWRSEADRTKTVKKSIEVNGTAFVQFDSLKDFGFSGFPEEYSSQVKIKFEASFNETLTGKEYMSEVASLILYKDSFKIELIPGHNFNISESGEINYIATVKVTTPDGQVPISDDNPNSLALHYNSWEHGLVVMRSAVPSNGLASFVIKLSDDVGHMFNVTYKGTSRKFQIPKQKIIEKSKHGSNSNEVEQLSVKILSPSSKNENDLVTVQVNSNETFKLVHYLVTIARDGIVANGKHSSPISLKEMRFNVSIPSTIINVVGPYKLIVYIILANGQVVAKTATFGEGANVNKSALKNQLNLTLSNSTVEPGSIINISLSTAPSSLIALRAIDSSVLLLKPDKDIDAKSLQEVLNFYQEGNNFDHGIRTFSASNVIFSTNALHCTNDEMCGQDEKCSRNKCVNVCVQACGVNALCSVYNRVPSCSCHASGDPYNGQCYLRTGFDVNEEVPDREYEEDITPGGFALERVWSTPASFPESADYFTHDACDQNPCGPNSQCQDQDGTPVCSCGPGFVGSPPFCTKQIRVRTKFPETWIWEEINSSNRSSLTIVNKSVPDTLTSWMISGYALHPSLGIGILNDPQKLTVVRPFFLTLNVPYSVVKGEIVAIQVLIHNYAGQNIHAQIELDNSKQQFNFVEDKNVSTAQMNKLTRISSSSVGSVTFIIIPNVFGTIELAVKGVYEHGGDALRQPLIVRPPGQQHFKNKVALLRNLDGNSTIIRLETQFPTNRVIGADKVELAVISDILGPTIENLDNLLQLPYGCGEQNMIHFVPDIVVLNYLTITGRLTPSIKSKALGYLQTGYQRELTYMHSDGSFSAFGNSDPYGSTWLTAFVVRSFHSAKPFITVDDGVVEKGLDFLTKSQRKDGSFEEKGQLLDFTLQGGGNSKDLTLTAYVLLAFIEVNSTKYASIIKNGTEFLISHLPESSSSKIDPYPVILINYVLQLTNHSMKSQLSRKVEALATSSSDGEFKYWKTNLDAKNNETKPLDIEMSSYALLTYLESGQVSDALPIVKWLLSQRNAQGGFLSTQDTVVGLTALGKFAELTSGNHELDLEIIATAYTSSDKSSNASNSQQIHVNKDNAIVLQQIQLDANTKIVEFEVSGKGLGLVQLTNSYWVEESNQTQDAFKTNVQVGDSGNGKRLKLRICTQYNGQVVSNMIIMNLNLPSGYVFDTDALENLKRETPKAMRYDVINSDTTIHIYFNPMKPKEDACVGLVANLVYRVAKQAPASVLVYDYYDVTKKSVEFYSAPELDFCELRDYCNNDNGGKNANDSSCKMVEKSNNCI